MGVVAGANFVRALKRLANDCTRISVVFSQQSDMFKINALHETRKSSERVLDAVSFYSYLCFRTLK